MGRLSFTRVAAVVLVASLAVVAWLLVGPVELGGPARYAIIQGGSMNPLLVDGDLAVVRANGEPAKGEVVLYHDDRLDVDVLHRIVGTTSNGRFVLKGDANDYLDDAHPTTAELGGTLWFSVPRVGSAVEWLQKPMHAALVVFVLVALALSGGGAMTRRRSRVGPTLGIAASAAPTGAVWRTLLTGALAAALVFGLLALAAFGRASSRTQAVEEARVHEGTISYFAPVEKSDVYPDGVVNSGETAFLTLVHDLAVVFSYRLTGEDPESVQGTASISAIVTDGAGWQRRVPVAAPREFVGEDATVRGTLDVAELSTIVDEMKRLTGSYTTTFSVRLEPRVEVSGHSGGEAFHDTFAPAAPFLLDDVSLRVDMPDDGSEPLSARTAEPGSVQVPASITFGSLDFPVAKARDISALGLAISLLIAVFAGAALATTRVESEHGRFASRFADRMISIAQPPAVDDGRITDVADLDSLARIAERYDRVIVHWRRGDEHVYLVDDGSIAYRYRTGRAAQVVASDLEDTLVLPQ
jgi:signal peptidase I